MKQNEGTDVLVIGGGTAGFGAAVAAGRAGFKVILLEATSKIGGVMAFCPGMPWGAGYPTNVTIGGLMEEEPLSIEDVAKIATLPTLNEARANIVGILNAPASKLVSILLAYSEKMSSLASENSETQPKE